ncbi:hypothetical protein ACOMHN_012872 [Nucella lapillus]
MLHPYCHPKPSCQRPVDEADGSAQPIVATDAHVYPPSAVRAGQKLQLSSRGIYKGEDILIINTMLAEMVTENHSSYMVIKESQAMDRRELHQARYGN